MKPRSRSRAADVPLDLQPMEARLVPHLPDDNVWQFEPKWDGFRCLAFRSDKQIEIRSKSGKSLSRFFPEVVANLAALPQRDFVLDGELVIAIDESLSFDALQMRLHPAETRIRKLSRKADALLSEPFARRHAALTDFFARIPKQSGLSLTPFTRDRTVAQEWLTTRRTAIDGIVAKRLDLAYRPGERAMLKVKCLRTADCVVGGFRYGSGSKVAGSLLLGLYDAQGLLHHVGYTSAMASRDKPALTNQLEKIVAAPGFTGDAPGGPSRWSTERSAEWQPLRPKLVVEVRYDHVTGGRFRHGTRLLRWRPDKARHNVRSTSCRRPTCRFCRRSGPTSQFALTIIGKAESGKGSPKRVPFPSAGIAVGR